MGKDKGDIMKTVKLAIEFGELIIGEESKIPMLPVNVFSIGEDGTKTLNRTNYLCPFRGYCFQVCGTKDGDGDCGSSGVIGLGHILTISRRDGAVFRSNYDLDGIEKELIRGQISLAMNQYYGVITRHLFRKEEDLEVVISSIPKMRGTLGDGEIDKFIDASIEWIKSFM